MKMNLWDYFVWTSTTYTMAVIIAWFLLHLFGIVVVPNLFAAAIAVAIMKFFNLF